MTCQSTILNLTPACTWPCHLSQKETPLVIQYKMDMRVSGSRICLYILPKSFMNKAGIDYCIVFVKNWRRFIAHSQHLGEGGTGNDLYSVSLNFSPKQTVGTVENYWLPYFGFKPLPPPAPRLFFLGPFLPVLIHWHPLFSSLWALKLL